MFLLSAGKREQLLNAADWMSGDRLPVRVSPAAAVTPVVRLSEDRRHGAVVLLNWGLDAVEGATLEIRAPQTRARLLTPTGEIELPALANRPTWSVALPRLEAWSSACLLIG